MSKKPEQSKQVDEHPNTILRNIENNSEKMNLNVLRVFQ